MRKNKTDKNQKAICAGLQKVGATVAYLQGVKGGCPDLIVGYKGKNYLFEIKNPETNGQLNDLQKEFFANWKGQVVVIKTLKEAYGFLGIERNVTA
jgi:hypothetical protein